MKTCSVIKYQIKDEKKAAKEYRKLAKRVRLRDMRASNIIQKIAQDESRHRKILSRISRKIC